MRVYTNPDASFIYYGFYLSGLEDLDGRLRLRFRSRGLPRLSDPKDGMPLELHDGRKVFIAANDWSHINAEALEWCDVLGIVNFNPEDVPHEGANKIVPIGPSFGVKWHGTRRALDFVLRSALVDRRPRRSLARLVAYTRHQNSRAPLDEYVQKESDPGYIFYAATYWQRHPEANRDRAVILDTVRAIATRRPLTFEGGFVARSESVPQSLRLADNYEHLEYLGRMKRSAIAFNTPAVHQCLGWKLGEFLALGKAIVSTPLTRVLPEPLEHGFNIHFIDGTSDSIEDAVEKVTRDHAYRRFLEGNARRYWENWLTPRSVMHRLLGWVVSG